MLIYTLDQSGLKLLRNGEEVLTFPDKLTANAGLLSYQALALTENKNAKKLALNAWHDSQTQAMKAKYSQSEFESFLDKRTEAMAWRANNTTPTPYIDAMAGGIATVRTMLITSILAKVDATAQLEMIVLTKRDAIDVCTTQAQLDAVVW